MIDCLSGSKSISMTRRHIFVLTDRIINVDGHAKKPVGFDVLA